MTSEQTRQTMNAYAKALLAFGDISPYLADDVRMVFMGTDRKIAGKDAVQQTIKFFHEIAFSSAINVKGLLYGIAAALPIFRRQGFGHFVNTISTAGIQISPTMAVYAATKNAVRTLSEGLRLESDGKYRVTGISPGFVGTNFAESMTDPGVRAGIQKRMDEIALKPEAIARAMAFAIEQPGDVDVGDIVVRPTVQ